MLARQGHHHPCLLWFSGLIILICYSTLLPSKIQAVQADIEHSEFIQSLSSSPPHSSQPPAIHVWFLNPALFICQMLRMGGRCEEVSLIDVVAGVWLEGWAAYCGFIKNTYTHACTTIVIEWPGTCHPIMHCVHDLLVCRNKQRIWGSGKGLF